MRLQRRSRERAARSKIGSYTRRAVGPCGPTTGPGSRRDPRSHGRSCLSCAGSKTCTARPYISDPHNSEGQEGFFGGATSHENEILLFTAVGHTPDRGAHPSPPPFGAPARRGVHNRRLDISRRDAEAQREREEREVLSLSPPRLGLLRVSPAFQAETDPSVTTDLGRPPLALCVLASLREARLPGVHTFPPSLLRRRSFPASPCG